MWGRVARRWYFQSYSTPNPNSIKFKLTDGKKCVMKSNSSVYISNMDEASKTSNLAKILFTIENVNGVMLGPDFITINKQNESNSNVWDQYEIDKFKAVLIDFYNSDLPVINEEYDVVSDDFCSFVDESVDVNDPVVASIIEVLETKVRPVVHEDGGDIKLVAFDKDSGIVKLQLQGSCSNCPSSAQTLKNGIKNMLQYYVDEVVDVVEVLSKEERVSLSEFEKLEREIKKKETKSEQE